MRETKFAKFPGGGACPQTPLEARAVGARLSAFGAKRASLFLLKRGWNVCLPQLGRRRHQAEILSSGGSRKYGQRYPKRWSSNPSRPAVFPMPWTGTEDDVVHYEETPEVDDEDIQENEFETDSKNETDGK